MPTTKLRDLANSRAEAFEAFKAANDAAAGPDATADLTATADKALAEVERLDSEYRRAEAEDRLGEDIEAAEPAIPQPRRPVEDDQAAGYDQAVMQYLRHGRDGLTPNARVELQKGFVQAAQGVGTDAAGGYTVPEGFRTKMVETMQAFGGILGLAEQLTTASGNDLPWPTNDDTANVGAILAENTQIGEQDFTFGTAQLGAYVYTSKLVKISYQLLQDSAFDFGSWLPRRLGIRIARALAAHLVAGNGTSQPQGLVTGLDATATETATASTLAFDDLITVEHDVDPAYRPRGRYVLADGALEALRKLKDSNGQYLWSPGTPVAGVPSTLNGRPYTVDNNMTGTLADGTVPLVFGDIAAAYVVRNVRAVQAIRLDERYADYLQVGFFGFARFDAVVQDASAAQALKIQAV